MNTKGTGNRDVSSAINGFLETTTGTDYLKKIHRCRRLPRLLIGAKKAKEIKKKMDYFNEDIFKPFWEAEGGHVSLATISSSWFHENVEALDEDPEYEHYNAYSKK